MGEFTLLKLQLDDASFTAKAPFSGTESDEGDEEDTDEEGPGLFPLLAGIVFLVILGVAVRKLRGGGEEELLEGPVEAVTD